MLGAGKRPHRVRFERRHAGEKSPSGNVLEAWRFVCDRWAGMRPKFGGEQVKSGQLESTMIGNLTVLADPETRDLQASDRVVFLAGPYARRVFQIRSIVPTPDSREIEFLIEHGPKT